ncbi:hypothetical protein ACVOMT_06430 [Sphingomonas panni]
MQGDADPCPSNQRCVAARPRHSDPLRRIAAADPAPAGHRHRAQHRRTVEHGAHVGDAGRLGIRDLGALYTGTLVFAVYQALPKQRGNPLLARLRMPASGAFLGNALWAAYTQLFGLSFPSAIIILFTLACLLATLSTFAGWPHGFSAGERWCAALPLTALASWLTVASIVNIAASLRFHGIDAGASAPLVSALLLVVAGAIAAAALIATRGCPPYALVFLWALAAIWAAGGQAATLVALAVLAAALLVVVGTLTGLSRGGVRHWLGR